MEQKYKLFLFNKSGFTRFPINNLWATSKTYYEENSKFVDRWEWGSPHLNYDDYDALYSYIVSENPTIVGFSVYMWNEAFVLQLSSALKNHFPNLIVVFGGPQSDIKYNNNYFKTHTYVDLVIPGDAYGERSLAEILDNIVLNNGKLVASEISYAYWPDADRIPQFNSIGPKKSEFKWPKNSFRAQEQYLIPILDNVEHEARWLSVETSRGCPYKCAFCDWGGGIYTKTVKKDFSTILDEITWVGENKIVGIWITDANFGIFNIDIEITKHIVAVAEKYGYPKMVQVQPSKTKLENLSKIYDLLSGADLMRHYQISIQDVNDEIKKNIDRVDFPFEVQVDMFRELQKKKNLPILIETILGLPGSSIDTVKDNIHRICIKKLIFPISYHWTLLPETPAYAPEFREKWKLVTVLNKSFSGSGAGFPTKQKINRTVDPGVNRIIDDGFDMTSEFVVGTSSYTPDDWIEMNMMQLITASTQPTEIINLVGDYLWQEHAISYGDFYHEVGKQILYNDSDHRYQSQFSGIKTAFANWVYGDAVDTYCDAHPDLPFELSPPTYCIFAILTNIDLFFEGVLLAISKLTELDDKIIDLCHYSKNRLIDIDYQPTVGRTFETVYDWPKYIQTTVLDKTAQKYTINETQMYFDNRYFDIDWNQYDSIERYKHFVYRVCYSVRYSKVFQQMKIV